MSRKKPEWTEPGAAVERAQIDEALEAGKGTAAANPVLSLSPDRAPAVRRPTVPAEVTRSAPPTGAAALPAGATAGAVPLPTAQADGQAPGQRSPAEIEADIAAARDRLAQTLDELSERLSPRGVLRQANGQVRGAFVTADGSVRKDRAVLVGGALVVLLAGLIAVRGFRR